MIHKNFVFVKKEDPFFPTELTLRCSWVLHSSKNFSV